MKNWVLYLVIVILVVAGVVYFVTKQPAKEQELAIGVIAPISGEAATFGISTKEGIELAAEEWNTAGGINGMKIVLKVGDDKGDPTTAVSETTRLIEMEKVKAIVGTVMSKCSIPMGDVANEKQIPMISPTSTNPKVTLGKDYVFRACFLDPFQGTVGANFAYRDLGLNKAAAIFDVGNDYTKGLAEFFQAQFVKLGGSVVAFEAHPSGATDFRAQLQKIIGFGPQLIYIPDYYNDVGLIAKQARELGFTGPFLGGDGWDSPDLVKIGGEAIEGGFYTNHFSKDDTRPIVIDFVSKYKAKFGKEPDALAALAYDAANVMFDAIKRANSTEGPKIKDALKTASFKAVSGTISFDPNGDPIKSAVIIEIKGGMHVYRATVAP